MHRLAYAFEALDGYPPGAFFDAGTLRKMARKADGDDPAPEKCVVGRAGTARAVKAGRRPPWGSLDGPGPTRVSDNGPRSPAGLLECPNDAPSPGDIGADPLRANWRLRLWGRVRVATTKYEVFRQVTINPAAGTIVWPKEPTSPPERCTSNRSRRRRPRIIDLGLMVEA